MPHPASLFKRHARQNDNDMDKLEKKICELTRKTLKKQERKLITINKSKCNKNI